MSEYLNGFDDGYACGVEDGRECEKQAVALALSRKDPGTTQHRRTNETKYMTVSMQQGAEPIVILSDDAFLPEYPSMMNTPWGIFDNRAGSFKAT